jgi:hypothetical protein
MRQLRLCRTALAEPARSTSYRFQACGARHSSNVAFSAGMAIRNQRSAAGIRIEIMALIVDTYPVCEGGGYEADRR